MSSFPYQINTFKKYVFIKLLNHKILITFFITRKSIFFFALNVCKLWFYEKIYKTFFYCHLEEEFPTQKMSSTCPTHFSQYFTFVTVGLGINLHHRSLGSTTIESNIEQGHVIITKHTKSKHLHIHTHIHIKPHMRTHTHTHTHIHTHTHTHTH